MQQNTTQQIEFTRTAEVGLDLWLAKPDRKPLLIRGARQVGKSFLVRMWAEKNIGAEQTLEINLEEQPRLRDLFKRSLDPLDIMRELHALTGFEFKEGSLLFIDEIQSCPEALTALRYFYEKRPQQLVIAAGSLLEFILEEISFPVGRVQSLYMFPMSFSEFVAAVRGSELRDRLMRLSTTDPAPTLLHEELSALMRLYFKVGGMPKVVSAYVAGEDFALATVATEQREILQDYSDDLGKLSKRVAWDVLQVVYSRLPSFMLMSNIKLSKLGDGLRAEKVRAALRLFELAHIVTKANSSSASKPPLESLADPSRCKYAFLDIGLLQSALGFDWSRLTPDADLLEIYSGVFAEQFVAQELLCSQDLFTKPRLYYWDRSVKGSEAEVDFLIEVDSEIMPLEVKNSSRGRLKSLLLYLKEMSLTHGIILSQRNIEERDGLKWLPLYLAGRLREKR
jgi:predicted AAA+ superfamily ATPase